MALCRTGRLTNTASSSAPASPVLPLPRLVPLGLSFRAADAGAGCWSNVVGSEFRARGFARRVSAVRSALGKVAFIRVQRDCHGCPFGQHFSWVPPPGQAAVSLDAQDGACWPLLRAGPDWHPPRVLLSFPVRQVGDRQVVHDSSAEPQTWTRRSGRGSITLPSEAARRAGRTCVPSIRLRRSASIEGAVSLNHSIVAAPRCCHVSETPSSVCGAALGCRL